MRYLTCILFFTAMLFACQPKNQTLTADNTITKTEVNAMMDKYLSAWNAKDVITLSNLLTDDGLFCGTDPTELLDKKMITDAWKQVFADSTVNNTFTVDKRVIRVVPDGKSALVMEQHLSNPYTPKIPWRLIIQTVKTVDGWKIDYLSWNLIPKNEDIGKLNLALQ